MKLLKSYLTLIFSLGIFSILLVPTFVYANNITDTHTLVVLPKAQTINEDYFAAGETVALLGTVNGDAYVAGANVIIEGIVNGDLLVAGGTVTIRGKVTQDVRVAGGQIIVSGDIGRNLTTAGGSVTITDGAGIAGSLVAGAGNLSVFAPIGKEANIGGGQVILANTIHGDLRAGVGQLTLTPTAKVLGNLTYWSEEKAHIDSASQISGKTTHNLPPQPSKEEQAAREKATKNAAEGFSFAFNIVAFLSALIVGLLLITFMPVYTQQTATMVLKKPLLSLGVGFLAMLSAPVIFILLFITIVGIPLDLILLAGFLIFIYLAKIFVAVAIGQKVFILMNKKIVLGWTLVAGLIIYSILSWIPFLGFLFWMIAGLMGLGSIFLEIKDVYSELRKKKLI